MSLAAGTDVIVPVPERVEEAVKPDPVQLTQVRVCHFKQKPCSLCGESKGHSSHTPKKTATCRFGRQNGCARCGRNKGDAAHFGAPPSFNVWSGQGTPNTRAYSSLKRQWEGLFAGLLKESGLPRGQERVYVEGEITFPDHRDDRDEGNFRVLIEKALGDALVYGGWLRTDRWGAYQFGALFQREVPGESATRLMIYTGVVEATPLLPFAHELEQLAITSVGAPDAIQPRTAVGIAEGAPAGDDPDEED